MDLRKNYIIHGDCAVWLKEIQPESVDLCYIDPPFFTQRDFVDFTDKWEGGIKHYIDWMRERLIEIRLVLSTSGSIMLHCDWRASHKLRVLLDDLFGEKNFTNEFIWCYSRPSSPNQRMLNRTHQTIHIYSKTKKYKFFPDNIRQNYSKSSKDRGGYASNKSKMAIGIVKLNPKGKFPDDWKQVQTLRGNSEEFIGYRTQKPEVLIAKFIKGFTNKGDIVLDCFGGSGTTAKVAADLGRRFITGDISEVACNIMAERLKKAGHTDFVYKAISNEE